MTGPGSDGEIRDWVRGLGLPGLIDIHVHFMPERVLAKVWAYFDAASEHYGVDWPVRYRFDEPTRLAVLRGFGVIGFAPLLYPHKPAMAEWLNDWAAEFAEREPDAVPTATFYPEPGADAYLARALERGVRCLKAHVQVGDYDPADPLLDKVWGLVAESGVPVVIHCGHGPLPGRHTGLDVFETVLRRHPRLTAVLAHAGTPDYLAALELVRRYPRVHLDTTMVGVAFTERNAPLPADWTARLAEFGDRVALGTDYPNIPYEYSEQLRAIAGWAQDLGPEFLRAVLHDTPARLLGR
ncbi:amidohydrolase family protein [Crossiella sp. CA-258035]|uniref:amidohydrolase family protein n=1 Tax=Crossiella sp. CA-258035 TaxID=2981138 RepID=UPI0024BCEE7E|nr:amidohydrolase family protein [Crossiella sp. CA-258035]WHT18447.1 amidohydrolase family protein [Crossiella sp. CA-258035]